MTVAVGLAYFRGENSTKLGALMAASLVSIVPILVLFVGCPALPDRRYRHDRVERLR